MKAYKIIEVENINFGRILVRAGDYKIVLCATPTKAQEFYYSDVIWKMLSTGKCVLVELSEETWVHPHLFKPIKDQLNGK